MWTWLLAAAFVPGVAHAAPHYKCVKPEGRVLYQQLPCDRDTRQLVLISGAYRPAAAQPVGSGGTGASEDTPAAASQARRRQDAPQPASRR